MSPSFSTHHTRDVLGACLALALLTTTGCDEQSVAPTSSSAIAPTTDATVPATGPNGCAWRTRADRETENIAYPDTAATYWAMAYELDDDEQLVLRGRFAEARYQSFTTYDSSGAIVAGLADRDIVPLDGDVNPFAGRGGAAGGGFVVTVGADVNGPNRLPGPTSGTVVHRVYRSNIGGDPTGGVGLPAVALVSPDGSRRPIPTCATPGANPRARALVADNGPDTSRAAPPVPVFVGAEGANLYANPDNAYLATLVEHRPGRIVVVRGRAPTFPHTGQGQSVRGDEQVRYWSVCTNEWRRPYPVSACVADEDVRLDAEGRFTIVVSTQVDRPETIDDHASVTWLDWGATDVDLLVLVRQMLAAEGFPGDAARVAPGDLALATLGEYAPVAVLCTRSRFDRLGPDGCR